MTFWELLEYGAEPYADLDHARLQFFLAAGMRLPRPGRCPIEIFRLMEQCWELDHAKRPYFPDVVRGIQQIRREGPTEWAEGQSLDREYVGKLPDRGAYREAGRNRTAMKVTSGDREGDQMIMRAKSIMAGAILHVDDSHLQLDRSKRASLLESEGRFGPIFKGMLSFPGQAGCQNREVAVKSFEDQERLCQLCKRFDNLTDLCKEREVNESRLVHKNVVEFIGIQTTPAVHMIFEFVGGGTLLEHLQHLKTEGSKKKRKTIGRDLQRYVSEIAEGMEYLAENGVVHDRLATGNVLVTSGPTKTLKISNFGEDSYNLNKGGGGQVASSSMYEDAQSIATRVRFLPKWSSPERLLDNGANELADVWSFGVTAWECMAYGVQPYAGMTDTETIAAVCRERHRLKIPSGCPKSLYSIMLKCWHHEPRDRPKFSEIVPMLAAIPVTMGHKDRVDDLVSASPVWAHFGTAH